MVVAALISPASAATNTDSYDLGSINFAKGSAKLTKTLKAQLDPMIANLSSEDTVTVTGYDPKGGGTKLALKRANAIKKYIETKGFAGTVTAVGANSTSKSSKKLISRVATVSTVRTAYSVGGRINLVTGASTSCANFSVSSVSFDGAIRDYSSASIVEEQVDTGGLHWCQIDWTMPTVISGSYRITLNVSCEEANTCELFRDGNTSSDYIAADSVLTLPMHGASGAADKTLTLTTNNNLSVSSNLIYTNYSTSGNSFLSHKLVQTAY
jgi:hypothetical protein